MDKKIEELKNKISKLEKELKNTKEEEKPSKKNKARKSFVPTKVLFKWKGPSRVFVKRDKVWYLKVAAIALLLILFFAFLQDFIVILVICVIVLVAFLLASIPPEKVTHEITNKGIKSIDKLYKWEELDHFRVNRKSGHIIISVKTKMRFPAKLELIVNRQDERKIVKMLGKELDYEEIEEKQGWLSRLTDGEVVQPSTYYELFGQEKRKKKKKGKK